MNIQEIKDLYLEYHHCVSHMNYVHSVVGLQKWGQVARVLQHSITSTQSDDGSSYQSVSVLKKKEDTEHTVHSWPFFHLSNCLVKKKLYGSVSWQISLAWFLILIWNSANLHCQRLKCLKGRTYRNAEPYPWDEWMTDDICFLVILLVIFSPFFLYRTWEQCGVDWICFLLVCDQQREMSAVSERQSFGKEMYRRA